MPLNDALSELVGPNGHTDSEPMEEVEASEVEAPESVLAVIRRRARELREQQTIVLDIPGYDGYLAARFRAVSIGRIFSKRADGSNPLSVDWTVAADILGGAVDDVLIRDSPDGEAHPVFTDQTARFDDDLVEALELEPAAQTARAVLVSLCGGEEMGESRVWSLFMQYQGWLVSGVGGDDLTEGDAAGRAVGEYPPR